MIQYHHILGVFLLCLFSINPLHLLAEDNASSEGNYHALVIAIDNYSGDAWTPLKNPVGDATAIEKILKAKYGFANINTLYNEQATRASVIETLDKITKGLTNNDNLFIFYSGHGLMIGDEGYWIPSEAKSKERYELISTTEIKNAVSKSKSKHILMMVDACFGSTIFKSSALVIQNDGSEEYYEQVEDLLSRQAITAGGLEPVPDGKGEHSIFSKYIIKFLTKNEKPALDAGELFNMIKFPVAANTPNMPQFGHLQNTGHEGGQFIFRLKKQKVCESEVYIEQGEIINFPKDGGELKAVASEKNVTFEWSYNSELLDYNGPTLKVTKAGEYGVTAITEDGECSDAAIAEVSIVLPKISLEIMEGNDIEFTYKGELNANLGGYSGKVIYEWKKNNFLIGKDKTITVTSSDNYTITARLPDGRLLGSATTKVVIKDRTYTTRIGDDVRRIARKFYGASEHTNLIYAANPDLEKGAVIKVGVTLVVPPLENHTEGEVKIFSLGASKGFAPFTGSDLYKGGMITNIVSKVFEEMEIPTQIDYLSNRVVKSMTYNGRTGVGFPFVKNKNETALFLYSAPLYSTLNVFFAHKSLGFNDIETELKIRKKKNEYRKITVAATNDFISDRLNQYVTNRSVLIKTFPSLEACFKALQEGKVDLVASPQIAGLVTINRSYSLQEDDFKIFKKEIGTNSLHMAISKQHPDAVGLIKEFNETLKKLKASGAITKIVDTHIDLIQKAP